MAQIRHGDRAQISRALSPAYPENEEVTEKWRSLLPSEGTLQRLLRAAKLNGFPDEDDNLMKNLYNGGDSDRQPYAQLTELGAQQLILAGQQLRKRYASAFELDTHRSNARNLIECRSTFMCRTIQSLRSLLYGLFISNDEVPADFQPPLINVRPIDQETLFPQYDGGCPAMTNRRSIVNPPNLVAEGISNYASFDSRIRTLLGIPAEEKVNWLNVKEILTCHEVHNINLVKGITPEDVDKASEITGWTWGVMYKVKNRRRDFY